MSKFVKVIRKENCSLDTVSIKRIGLLCVKKNSTKFRTAQRIET